MRGKYFLGLFLILVGAGLLMDQMGYIDFGDIIGLYWPVILILSGISGLFDRSNSKTGSFILIALGVLLQLNRLDYIEVDIFRLFFPIILIIIGLNIIFTRGIRKHSTPVEPEKWTSENAYMDDTVNQFVLFSGSSLKNQSLNFKGGKASAVFGGIELDLRGAQLKDNQGFLDITTLFGGIDIRVPDNWRVEMQATPLLGGIDNNTKSNPGPDVPVLKISATAIFGGIDINN